MNRPTDRLITTVDRICHTLNIPTPEPFTKQRYQLFIALNLHKASAIWKVNRHRFSSVSSYKGPSRRQLQRDADFIGAHCSTQAVLDYLSEGGLAPRNMNGTRDEIIARLRDLGYVPTSELKAMDLQERLEYERRYPYGEY